MARPREFETSEALDAMMDVFWRQGFEGASMHDIETATGLNKQSLYRVFDDKRGMYLAALKHYENRHVREAAAILAGSGPARAKFRRLFDGALAPVLESGDRSGCFLCNASADQAQLDDDTQIFVGALMADLKRAFEQALAGSRAFQRRPRQRELLAAKLLAGYVGLRVLIRANTDEATLIDVVNALLADIAP